MNEFYLERQISEGLQRLSAKGITSSDQSVIDLDEYVQFCMKYVNVSFEESIESYQSIPKCET